MDQTLPLHGSQQGLPPKRQGILAHTSLHFVTGAIAWARAATLRSGIFQHLALRSQAKGLAQHHSLEVAQARGGRRGIEGRGTSLAS